VEDVAAAILDRLGPLDTFKLQKLVYYSQAWHLAWKDEPIFPERVEAWANGPVVRRLFDLHQGRRTVTTLDVGSAQAIPQDSTCIIDFVCGLYGRVTGNALARRTHHEQPWAETRRKAGLANGQPGNPVISQELMKTYYRSLPAENEDAWYWTPEWWRGEQAADEDITAGNVKRYLSSEEFLSSL
jgi:uncharacterized phage-associated protein